MTFRDSNHKYYIWNFDMLAGYIYHDLNLKCNKFFFIEHESKGMWQRKYSPTKKLVWRLRCQFISSPNGFSLCPPWSYFEIITFTLEAQRL